MSDLRSAILTALEPGPLATWRLVAKLADHDPAEVRAELARLAAEQLIERTTRTRRKRIGPIPVVSRTEFIHRTEHNQ